MLNDKNTKILIIDDHQETRQTLSDILEEKGFTVKTAADGRSALSLMEKESFTLALIDINLPDIEGVELLKSLKAVNPRIEGIIITGHASIKNASKAIEEGAFAYLLKPIRMEEALANIRAAIEKQRNSFEFNEKIMELETFRNLAQGREAKEKELKKKINNLLSGLGRPKKYPE